MNALQASSCAAILTALTALLSTVAASPSDREQTSLNGIWDFYPNGGGERHAIRVPSFWDAPQDYGYPADWLHLRHGIYKTSFRVPESMRTKQIYLRIERVPAIAKLFINGTQVGAEDSNGYLMMQLPYPTTQLNTENLYEVYRANPRKPTGEGESLYPEGFPLTLPDGSCANQVSQRGEFGHPDMISQGTWIRSVCRMFRAMRYAGLSDASLYANWMLAFDPPSKRETDAREWEVTVSPTTGNETKLRVRIGR